MPLGDTPDGEPWRRFPNSERVLLSSADGLAVRAAVSVPSTGDLAIVAMACRFPGADTPDGFWTNLQRGVCSFDAPPADHDWSLTGPGARGAFLADAFGFDATLFGWSDEDAAFTDPQQRLLLEASYEALERAGLAGPRRRGRQVGVFVGVGHTDYLETIFRRLWAGAPVPASASVGNLRNLVAARVAHAMDLKGPAMAIDTACSSSLVAIHQARESLLGGECDVALAGGVTLNLTATAHWMLDQAGAISPSGRLAPFARAGDGIVLGEGCGVLVLERLERALGRGAPVLAVIRGSAINNDGRSVHPMAPRPGGQREVITAAWARAGLDPCAAGYVEAHGTGTRVGDAVETRSIVEVCGPRDPAERLLLGSVKGNVGHMLSAAGMPSVLKVVLALIHRELPPSLHLEGGVNLDLGLAKAGVEVVAERTPWIERRLAGVNGFGFGGTNAHIIVGAGPEAREPAAAGAARGEPSSPIWALTAASASALRQSAARLAAWLRAHPDADPALVARDVRLARDPMEHRLAFEGSASAAERLEAFAREGAAEGVRVGRSVPAPRGTQPVYEDALDGWLEHGAPLPVGDGSMAHGLSLPTYPFEHRMHCAHAPELTPPKPAPAAAAAPAPAAAAAEAAEAGALEHPLLTRLEELTLDRAVFAARIEGDDLLVAEHTVHGVSLLPGAGCVEILRAAAERAMGQSPTALTDVAFLSPVFPGADLRVVVERRAGGIRAAIHDEAGRELARASVVVDGAPPPAGGAPTDVLDRCSPPGALYSALAERGMIHGPGFQAIRAIDHGGHTARADLQLPAGAREGRFGIHPALLDAAMQPVATILLEHNAQRSGLWVPLHVEVLSLSLPPEGLGDSCTTVVRFEGDPADPGDTIRCDVTVRDRDGEIRLHLAGLRLHRVGPDAPSLWSSNPSPFAELVWTAIPRPPAAGLVEQRWLVVPVAHPAGGAIADGLRAAGSRVERVDPAELELAFARGERVEGVVFVGAAEAPVDTLDALERARARGVGTLAAVARTIDEAPAERRPRRIVVTTAGATTGVAPEQATALGACFALPDEIGGLSAVAVDVASPEPDALAEAAVLGAALAESGLYRVMGGALERRSSGALERAPEPRRLPEGGVHLLTGGGSGIGYAVAESLAAAGRTLILVGRRPLADDPERAERVRALRERGARVEYVACDVSDEDSVRGLVARVALDFGSLAGVVHAAGVVAPGRIRSRTDAELERVLAPKVRGTWLLWRELQRRSLTPGYMALFSSTSASLEGLGGGLGDYVAANAYLDAFAQARRAEGHPVVAIAWSAWSETGMGAQPLLLQSLAARGLAGITTREGVRAFHGALALDRAQVIVAPAARTGSVASAASAPRPAKAAAPVAVEGADPEQLVQELRVLVAAPLEITPDEVSTDVSFLSMGLDSLVALELVKELEERLDRELSSTLFFEHPTIEELASHLAGLGYRGAAPAAVAEPSAPASPEVPALSKTQRAFWIQERLHPDRPAFSFLRQTVHEPIDCAALEAAARYVIERHPILRARVDLAEGEPLLREGPVCAPMVRDHGSVADVEALADSVTRAPGDPAHPPAWRLDLARDETGPARHLLLCAHHLVADAWSLHLLAVELWDAYGRALRGELAAPTRAPADAAIDVDEGTLRHDLDWWRGEVARIRPLALPADGEADPDGARLTAATARMSVEATAAFVQRARGAGVSPFHLSLAIYARQLARWAHTDRVTVNVARARRELRKAGAAEAIGSFADTLPLTLELRPGEPLEALAARTRERMGALEAHATPTSVDLAPLLPRDPGGLRVASPASYSFARFPVRLPEGAPAVVESAGRTGSAATRLGLAAWEHDGALCFALDFATDLFRPATARRLVEELAAEHARVGGSAAAAAAPEPESLAEQIVARLREAPSRTALVADGREVSALELDRASASVAGRLQAEGIGPGDLVAVVAEQGLDAVVAIAGILRAGAGWVPMDPAHPAARLCEQAERVGPRLALLGAGAPDPGLGVPTHAIGTLAAAGAEARPIAPPAASAIAYVIFTSGSTGRPKGVPIPHGALARYARWALETFAYGPEDVTLGTSSPCFDASVRQLLMPLLAGARLVTAPRRIARDPDALLELLEREQVTLFATVPSLLARVARALEGRDGSALASLRLIQCGGETLPATLVRSLFDRLPDPPPIANLYGPTETTINVTHHVVHERPGDDVERIPIGHAAAGAVLRIVDGELWVGGPSLSPGYLDDPEQTARAFVETGASERMYRTGDRVARRADGALEFLGRIDDQVKLHGYRIEPGEIETALGAHPAVALAAVRAVGTGVARHLEAWVQPLGDPPTSEALRALLRSRLPEAMVPRHFHVVDALPLTASGKVDRRALAAVDRPAAEARPGPAPVTATERLVAEAFAGVLGLAGVGRDDDFFAIGGDSMGALEVFARLEPAFDPLPRAAVLYQAPTPRALALAIERARGGNAAPARPEGEGEWFPLSATQRGFVAARTLARGPSQMRWAALLRLEGPLDLDAFRRATDYLVERHPMLRTVVELEARPPRQRVLETLPSPLQIALDCDEAELEGRWAEASATALDPAAAPPVAMTLCRLGAERHALLIVADHLLGDALSGWMLMRELIAAHDAFARGAAPELRPLTARFRDFVETDTLRAPERSSGAHWRRVFAAPYPSPTRWYRPSASGPASLTFELSPPRVETLRRAASAGGHTLHTLLLGAWAHTLAAHVEQDDLILGCALANREGPPAGLASVFGPFATALPVRLEAAADPSRTLKSAARAFAEARAHALTPGEILACLDRRVDPSTAAGARLFFTFMDFEQLGPVPAGPLRIDWARSRTEGELPGNVDVQLAARRLDGGLRLTLQGGAHAIGAAGLEALQERLLATLSQLAPPAVSAGEGFDPGTLDAALIGYLPAPAAIARALGGGFDEDAREAWRARLFPAGEGSGGRWVERLETELGASGLYCLPLFADELRAERSPEIAARVAQAIREVGAAGVGSTALAGMLPALTGYGHAAVRALGGPPPAALTIGHATTVVAVVKTIVAAARRARLNLAEAEVAVVGVGSIGAAATELSFDLGIAPRRLVLCDLPRARAQVEALVARLREAGFEGTIEQVEASTEALPDRVYRADLVLGAASTPGVLDVDRMRPGAVVVDDSFPHIFDVARARERAGDILITGGGLLACRRLRRTLLLPDVPAPIAEAIARAVPDFGVAGCQLEPLLRKARPELPAVLGPVALDCARRYWQAATELGLEAAPLHLGAERVAGPDGGARAPLDR